MAQPAHVHVLERGRPVDGISSGLDVDAIANIVAEYERFRVEPPAAIARADVHVDARLGRKIRVRPLITAAFRRGSLEEPLHQVRRAESATDRGDQIEVAGNTVEQVGRAYRRSMPRVDERAGDAGRV